MSGNVVDMIVLPLHLLWKVSVLLPSIGHNPTRVPRDLLEGMHLLMIIIGDPFDVVLGQAIKNASIGPQ